MKSENEIIEIIKEIEKVNNSKVICYLTNDSGLFNGSIAADIYPLLFEILEKIGKTERIDLFLFSHGGDTLVAWKFVNLIREYAREFNVLIPFHANSTATLIAIGANKIYMSRLANIGPIDPTLTTPFNPPVNKSNPDVNNNSLGLNVEDVIGYYELAKSIMDLKSESSILRTFEMLSQNVNPIALGAIYRSYNQIRSLARKLLELHMDAEKDKVLIDKIIMNLTEKLYNHRHLIVRSEAKQILGDKIIQTPSTELEDLVIKLYLQYKEHMNLHDTTQIRKLVGKDASVKTIEGINAIIESSEICYQYSSHKNISVAKNNGIDKINISDDSLGWVKSR